MDNIRDLINSQKLRMGISRQVEAVGVVEKATEEIAKFIPREDFEVISFNRGVLKISTSSSAVASEIRMRSAVIKNNNQEIKSLLIR